MRTRRRRPCAAGRPAPCRSAARQTFEGPFPAGEVPLAFALPRGASGTQLLRQPPRYWELEVHGAPDTVTFLVPVYAWPGDEEGPVQRR